MRGHGMGRHTGKEIVFIVKRDITSLADFLNRKPYLMGDEPCSLDASGYAFLANLLWSPVELALVQHAQTCPQLQIYCERYHP